MKYPAPSWLNNYGKVTSDVNTELKKQSQRTGKNHISKESQQEK